MQRVKHSFLLFLFTNLLFIPSLLTPTTVMAVWSDGVLQQDIAEILQSDNQTEKYIEELKVSLEQSAPENREDILVKLGSVLKMSIELFNPGPNRTEAKLKDALDSYIAAARIALSAGRVKYSSEISELAARLNDKQTLTSVFEEFLDFQGSEKSRYLTLIDYAVGLAKFLDPLAESFFEDAVSMRKPKDGVEAYYRYAQYLRDNGAIDRALLLLEEFTPEERHSYVNVALLRQQLIHSLGLDTTQVDGEISRIRQSLSGKPGLGAVIPPKNRGNQK